MESELQPRQPEVKVAWKPSHPMIGPIPVDNRKSNRALRLAKSTSAQEFNRDIGSKRIQDMPELDLQKGGLKHEYRKLHKTMSRMDEIDRKS